MDVGSNDHVSHSVFNLCTLLQSPFMLAYRQISYTSTWLKHSIKFPMRNCFISCAWFRRYLTNRSRRTAIERYASVWRYVPSGVPQDSIIGPLPFPVFLIFINDIAVNISADTNVPLYADHAKCFRKLLSLDDHDALQKDLHSIEGWSDLWSMFFNASKCKHRSISKKKKPINLSYQLGNNILAKTQCEKDLGVLGSC